MSICVYKHKHTWCKHRCADKLVCTIVPERPNFVNNCTTRNNFVCVRQQQQQQQQQQNNKNRCTVIPRRALPTFSALLLHFTWKPKMSKIFIVQTTFLKTCWKQSKNFLQLAETPISSLKLDNQALGISQIDWCSLSRSIFQGENFALSVKVKDLCSLKSPQQVTVVLGANPALMVLRWYSD